jgi:hypothetical protein
VKTSALLPLPMNQIGVVFDQAMSEPNGVSIAVVFRERQWLQPA